MRNVADKIELGNGLIVYTLLQPATYDCDAAIKLMDTVTDVEVAHVQFGNGQYTAGVCSADADVDWCMVQGPVRSSFKAALADVTGLLKDFAK